MNRDSINWRGYMPAITTPFDENGRLDLPALKKLLEWLADQGMHGLIVAGTTGEWFSLNAEEKARLFGTVGEVLKGEIPLIAGCNAFTATEVISNAITAENSGFDGILVTPPPYVRPCEQEVIAFYEDINQSTPLPICVYNWPPGTNLDLSKETLLHLADLDNVVALKNSTGNPEHFLDVMRALNSKVRIFGIPMSDKGAELVLNQEADGTMGAGGVLGQTQPDFYNALWAGDREAGLAAAALDSRIMQDWFNTDYTAKFGSAQAIFKTALNLQGLPGGWPRRPILPLQDSDVAIVRNTLEELGRL
ncbi:MAG TPA: dihydrodipicolinate synthase family protein [Xanthomonadales bacterium]|nr:dihydrodipicolinate synthase family protein [Xanthomonadales bacterium]